MVWLSIELQNTIKHFFKIHIEFSKVLLDHGPSGASCNRLSASCQVLNYKNKLMSKIAHNPVIKKDLSYLKQRWRSVKIRYPNLKDALLIIWMNRKFINSALPKSRGTVLDMKSSSCLYRVPSCVCKWNSLIQNAWNWLRC